MAKQEDARRVLVVGGGPAGLLTAHALQKHGLNVTVFEQDAALDARTRDWNFGIYWAQVPLNECLPEDLARQVIDCQVDSHRADADEKMPILNGETSELLKAIPIPYNIRLARQKFRRILVSGLDIRYAKKLKSVQSDGKSATALFEDGSTATGDLLIGAEGAHSVVRSFLLGPDKAALRDTPLVANTTLAKLPKDAVETFLKLASRFLVAFHPNGSFNWIGVHNVPEESQPGDWEFMMIQSWKPDDAEYDPSVLQGRSIVEDVKRRSQPFSKELAAIWHAVPDDTKCWHSRLSYWSPEPWDNRNGTVTLLGDAAHPMTFHRGQGLNNAILDVGLLAKCIGDMGLSPEAINRYELDMIPRGKEAVESSLENSLLTHDWATLMQSPLFSKGTQQK